MAGALGKYGFINAKLRTRLSAILSQEVAEQMIRAHTLPEAVGVLGGTDFAFVEASMKKTRSACLYCMDSGQESMLA